MEKYSQKLIDLAMIYGPRLIGAIVVLILGWWFIRLIVKGIRKAMGRSKIEPSLQTFISSLSAMTLKVLLVISVMSMMGIAMTSFIAVLGAAGLAVGMALSGTLQNFAGGVMILLFKPFKVGDMIEAQGYTGSVSEIQIFSTMLKTPDNRLIIIPNGPLATGTLTNYSTGETRRVEWTFGIGCGDDYDLATRVLKRFIDENIRILKDPAPFIALKELSNSSVNIVVRVWVRSADYWDVFFEMNEKVYKEFGKEGLNIY
ncbi:MAG: mechanosensitive ion channel [Chlorobi bacterium]|nr:mechanosensitive ion channel [Chlorobiota bacterium]